MNNDGWYCRLFPKFKARTNENIQAAEWLKSHAEELQFREVRTVLSVGAGTGDFDLQILSFFPALEKYVVVEPNQFMTAAFKQAIQRTQQEHEVSGGMLKDRNPDNLFAFECLKFEEVSIERFAELLSQERVSWPLFDLVIMSHCIYYMDTESVVLRTGSIARKLVIFKNINDINFHVKLNLDDSYTTSEEREKLGPYSDTQRVLEELAAKQRQRLRNISVAHSPCSAPVAKEITRIDQIRVDSVNVWQLPITFDAVDIDDGIADFLLCKPAEPQEREQLRQFLQRNLPDGHYYGSMCVFVVTFDRDRHLC